MRNQINGLLADFTDKDIEQIAVDTDRVFLDDRDKKRWNTV